MHILAIAIASVASFLLGSLWYSPYLFGSMWRKEFGLSVEEFKSKGTAPFIISFFYTIVSAIGFAYLYENISSLTDLVKAALVIGLLFVAPSIGINYQFSGRSMTSFLIDAGYHVARFAVFALVFWYIRR